MAHTHREYPICEAEGPVWDTEIYRRAVVLTFLATELTTGCLAARASVTMPVLVKSHDRDHCLEAS